MQQHVLAVGFVTALSMAVTAWSGPAQAPESQAEPHQARAAVVRLSLEQALSAAEERAPAVKAAARQQEAAGQKASAASRSRYGQLDGMFGYWRYQDDQILRPMSRQLFGPLGILGLPFDNDQLHYGLVFQAPLYAGGRLDATRDLAGNQAAQAALLVEGTRWEVRANIVALYAAGVSFDAAKRAADRNLDALDATRRRLTIAVEEGKRPRLDLLKVDEESADATARRALLEAGSARVRALLLAAMGRDPSEPVELEDLPATDPQTTVDDRALKAIVGGGSVVRRSQLQVDQAHDAARIAHAAALPTVAARANLMGNSALSIGEHMATWELSLGVTVPIFNGGARQAEERAAKAQEQAASAVAERTVLEREALLVETQARLQAARLSKRAALARAAAADEAARIEQVRYDGGSGTIEDLLRARSRQEASAAALAQAGGEVTSAAARLNAICEREVVR